MKKPLTVAIYSGVSTSTTFIERLMASLAHSGVKVYVFGAQNSKVKSSKNVVYYTFKSKLHIVFMLVKYTLLLTAFHYSDKKKLDNLIKSQSKPFWRSKLHCYPVLWHRPHVFHVQWGKGLADWMWVQEFNMSLVLSLRGAHINYSPIANQQLAESYRQNFRIVDGFHAVSKAIAKEAEQYGASSDKIKVVYSGLNINSFESHTNPSKNPVFKIISVGRPHWKKGYNYAIDACKLIKEQGISFEYSIIGGAGDIELLYQIDDLGLNDMVNLSPTMAFSKVKESIKSADILLLPSIEEGIANVVLEAMALRTLVVTTNCGGMSEVIQDNVNGFITEIRSPNKLAKKLLESYNLSVDRRHQIIDEARRTVEVQHNEAQMINGMLDLYNQLNPIHKTHG